MIATKRLTPALFAAILSVTAPMSLLHAQTTTPPPPLLWNSDQATHLIGLPDIKPKDQGTLAITPTKVIFTARDGQATIERTQLLSVSSGDERIETGGRTGKIIRMGASMAVPYGAGSVLGLATQGQVDLLTLEFLDEHHAYHGVVFSLPTGTAHTVLEHLTAVPLHPAEKQPVESCKSTTPMTLRLSPIAISGVDLPSEYRAVLYEQLVQRLRKQGTFSAIYRDGDRSPNASCPQFNLTLTVNTFRKGNAVLRASAGTVGGFLGATKLKFHVLLTDDQNTPILDRDLKASERGDGDSLDVSAIIAKSVTKKLRKQMRHRQTQTT